MRFDDKPIMKMTTDELREEVEDRRIKADKDSSELFRIRMKLESCEGWIEKRKEMKKALRVAPDALIIAKDAKGLVVELPEHKSIGFNVGYKVKVVLM